MTNLRRWKQRFQNFEKALVVFQDRCTDVGENPHGTKYYETCRMALIQAFEIILELSWKTLKDYLEAQGYTEVQNGKRAIRQAFQDGLIDDGELWLKALDIRNITSHTYDMNMLEDGIDFIIVSFQPALICLKNKLAAELDS